MQLKVSKQLVSAFLIVAFMPGIVAITLPLTKIRKQQFEAGLTKHRVNASTASCMFPVLCIEQLKDGQYQPLIRNHVNASKLADGDCRFLVPKEKEAQWKRKLRVNPEPYTHHGSFEVKRLPDGKQYFKVIYSWRSGMYSQAGWYIANAKHIYPQYEDEYAIGWLPRYGSFAIIGYIVLWGLAWRRNSRRVA